MRIDCRIQEANRLLACLQPLLVEKRNNRCENRRARGRAAETVDFTLIDGRQIEAQSGDVREAATGAVEDCFGVVWGVVVEVVLYGGGLPVGPGEDVGEAAAGVEVEEGVVDVWVGDCALAAVDGLGQELGGADLCCGEIRRTLAEGVGEEGTD